MAERPGPLFYLVRTAEDDDGIGVGVLRCIKPWTRWLLIKGFAAGKEVPDLPIERAIATIRDYLGLPDLQPEVTGVDPWTMNSLYATKYQNRRVFCIGDAVHRHVPLNGLGSNTAVQDAYNLSWKLAFVLKGLAEPHLLDTYTEERMPVGKEVVEHATGALALYPALLEAIGIPAASSSNELASMWAEINAPSAAGKTRRAQIRSAVENMVYEFQTRGLELNQFYRSSATIADEEPKDKPSQRDLIPFVTTLPGAHLPHAWVQRNGVQVSTLDLVGGGRFTLLTGVGGDAWVTAAEEVGAESGVEITAVAIGPGCVVTDLLFEWQSRREIDDDGCLLVRPDGYIAWRQKANSSHHSSNLADALRQVLGKQPAFNLPQ